MSSRSIRGCHFPDCKMLDVSIGSALNQIIQKSHCKLKISPEERAAQWQDRFLRGRQDCFGDLRVLEPGAHDSVLDDTDLCSITLRNENVQEFNTRRDEIFIDNEQDSHWMIFWKVCTNYEYASLINSKTALELYELEINQKISKPNHQKVEDHGEEKAWIKRSHHETSKPEMKGLKQEQW